MGQVPQQESTGADVADKTLRLQVGHKDTGKLPTKGDIQIETFKAFLVDIFAGYKSNTYLLQEI